MLFFGDLFSARVATVRLNPGLGRDYLIPVSTKKSTRALTSGATCIWLGRIPNPIRGTGLTRTA
jgi:hypothetical protein